MLREVVIILSVVVECVCNCVYFILQGSDPSQFENIQKIHTLQKRLISKTEEVVEKELLIQEKEKLYLELKHILARQPGPEVAEQLSIYQQTLKEKTKQMKVCTAFFFILVQWIVTQILAHRIFHF